MPRLIKPRALRPGGTLAIVAPAAAVDPVLVRAGAARFEAAGYRVRYRDDLDAKHQFLAGDDRRRAAELMEWVRDPEIDALVCARGGYGCQRTIAGLDAAAVRAARKPLVGYSDVTTLLLWQRRSAGLIGFHAPMLERGGEGPTEEFEATLGALRGEGLLPEVRRGSAGGGPSGRGSVRGRLVGGSLTTVLASLGTPWEIQTRGAIVLLEEIGERPYRLDRMLEQLRLTGKLDAAAGIGLGAFVDCDEPGGRLRGEEILDAWLERVGLPWVRGLPFGHASPNLPWAFGARAELWPGRAELHIVERGVSSR